MSVIILVGFMGCGKSSLGKKLAKKLHYDFIDSDVEIERIRQKSIPEIFEEEGEMSFRKLERDFVLGLKNLENHVVSSGGGLPCFGNNMEILSEAGITVYLKLSPKELGKRIKASKKVRPLAQYKTEEELVGFITKLLQEREQFYCKAQLVLNGKDQHPEKIIEFLGIQV